MQYSSVCRLILVLLLALGGLSLAQGDPDGITIRTVQPQPVEVEPFEVTQQSILVRREPVAYGGVALSTFFARPGLGVLVGGDNIGDTRGLGLRGDASLHTDGTFTLGANILYKLNFSADRTVKGYAGTGPRLAVTGNLDGNSGGFFGLGAIVGGQYDAGSVQPFAELDLTSYFDNRGALILPVFRLGVTIPF